MERPNFGLTPTIIDSTMACLEAKLHFMSIYVHRKTN